MKAERGGGASAKVRAETSDNLDAVFVPRVQRLICRKQRTPLRLLLLLANRLMTCPGGRTTDYLRE